MRLASKLPTRKGQAANDSDPREQESAEIIDLASRNAFPAVTQRKGKSDAMGLAAGIAIVAALGAVTLWGMNSARVGPPEGVGGQQPQAAASPAAVVPAPVATPVPPVPAIFRIPVAPTALPVRLTPSL